MEQGTRFPHPCLASTSPRDTAALHRRLLLCPCYVGANQFTDNQYGFPTSLHGPSLEPFERAEKLMTDLCADCHSPGWLGPAPTLSLSQAQEFAETTLFIQSGS